MPMNHRALLDFWGDGLEEAVEVDFDIQMGKVEGLAEYIRRNEGWVHPIAGETILQLLDGTHRTHRLKWGRSPKLNPKQLPLHKTIRRDYELATEVARKGGFRRGMYALVCHQVGQNQTPKMSGKTVEKLVRPHRKDQRFADLTKYLEQRARRK